MIDFLCYVGSLYKRFILQTQLLSRMSKPFWFTHWKLVELDNIERNAFKSLGAWGLESEIEVK